MALSARESSAWSLYSVAQIFRALSDSVDEVDPDNDPGGIQYKRGYLAALAAAVSTCETIAGTIAPGYRLVDGELMYSAKWLSPERG